MSESKFKTMRHIETVKNYLDCAVKELISREELHDQSKLQSPEVDIFEEYTPKLRGCTYGSDEYKTYLKEMQVALDHHYFVNSHHPEHFAIGPENNGGCVQSLLERMTLIDLIEMLCDWKAATLRHADGDIMDSLVINQKRFGYSDELASILKNTAYFLNKAEVFHHADES